MTQATILILALLLDAWLGEPRWLWDRVPHPAVLAGRAIGWADTRFNRGRDRRRRGALVLAGLVLAAAFAGGLIAALPDGGLLEVLAVAVLLAQRSLADHVAAVGDGLRRSLADGRRAVARIVGRDPAALDRAGVARAAIESAAENFSDGVIAPAFWYLVAGLPGIAVYKLVNTADSMIGHRTARHQQFGWAAARLDDLMNWVPARLAAGLLALAHGSGAAWRVVRADARRHRSPNAGWPEAAMAGLLGVALSGPRSYDGVMREEPYVNVTGRRDPGPAEIDAAVAALWRGWWAALAGLALLALAA